MDVLQIIELVGATIGLLYVWLEMRASMWLWPVGIVMSALYIYISLQAGIYGNLLINIYYLVAAMVGWVAWRKRRGTAPQAPHISHIPIKEGVAVLVAFTAIALLLWSGAERWFPSSASPIGDALATSAGVVGMWLLAREYIETWLAWILSNALYNLLFFSQSYIVTGIFYLVYTVISVLGAIRWWQLMRQTA